MACLRKLLLIGVRATTRVYSRHETFLNWGDWFIGDHSGGPQLLHQQVERRHSPWIAGGLVHVVEVCQLWQRCYTHVISEVIELGRGNAPLCDISTFCFFLLENLLGLLIVGDFVEAS